MHDRMKKDVEHSQEQTVEDVSTVTPNGASSAVHYASDAEVDQAMEKIFQQHDRLFAELAK